MNSVDETQNLPSLDLAAQIPTMSLGETEILFDVQKFEHVQRVAKLFSASSLVPKDFIGNVASCFVALHMAMRLNIDPFFLMQNMYVVYGRPAMEGKLAIALLNSKGPYENGVQFRYEGEGESRKCTAWGKRRDTGAIDECEISVKMAKSMGWWDKKDSMWPKMTDQMLAYRSGHWLAKRYCPEVTMGLGTVDEARDVGPVVAASSLNAKLVSNHGEGNQ